jgi:hypothetical protein
LSVPLEHGDAEPAVAEPHRGGEPTEPGTDNDGVIAGSHSFVPFHL